MKKLIIGTLVYLFAISFLNAQVSYSLTYDSGTTTYTVSMISGSTFTGGLARLTSSTQVSIVAPSITGGFQVTNITNLQGGATPLDWGVSQINVPAENTTADYLFFAPGNSGTYTPFDIPANTSMDLFSFQSGTGCEGDLALFNNVTDPLNTNTGLNPDNNFVVLGGGNNNLYITNITGSVPCSNTCSANAGVLSY